MSITVSIGRYGGFYIRIGYMWRVCLGWIAITIIPLEIDDILSELIAARKKARHDTRHHNT